MIAFRTVSGRLIDLEYPRPEDISIEDVARGLSNCCRFGGQISPFYSVAQHTMLVAHLVPQPLKFHALNHDDTEAYAGDMTRHLKHSDYMVGYRTIEDRLNVAILASIGVRPVTGGAHSDLKAADDLAAVYEHVMLREKRSSFDVDRDLHWAVRSGFINRRGVDHMMRFAHRLPPSSHLRLGLVYERWLYDFDLFRLSVPSEYLLSQ